MIEGIAHVGCGCCTGEFSCLLIASFTKFQKIVSADMFQKQMEGLSVVMVAQMTELMQKHIVTQRGWQTNDVEIEVDVVPGRATAPVCGVMLDGHAIIFKPISCGEQSKTGREFGLCLTPQCFDLLRVRLLDALVAFLLTFNCLDNPVPFKFEECNCCGERNKVWYRHAHTLDRMNTDAHTAEPFAFSENNLPDLRICIYLLLHLNHCLLIG